MNGELNELLAEDVRIPEVIDEGSTAEMETPRSSVVRSLARSSLP